MGCDLPSPGGLGLLLGVYFLSSWNQGLGWICSSQRVVLLSWKQVPLTPAPEIPHFKEVIIMATNCEYCGHRTNEVRAPLVGKTNLRVIWLTFTLLESALG